MLEVGGEEACDRDPDDPVLIRLLLLLPLLICESDVIPESALDPDVQEWENFAVLCCKVSIYLFHK
jgi:hypothetical protein